MRCIYNGKVFLPSPPTLRDSHRGVGVGDISSGHGWVVVVWLWGGGGVHRGVLERWVWGCRPVGLWAGKGSFAALGMCVMCVRVMPHEWA